MATGMVRSRWEGFSLFLNSISVKVSYVPRFSDLYFQVDIIPGGGCIFINIILESSFIFY